jgi:Trk-type K+ transport system membrane component
MWVGASPGSTGGGIKTSTFALAVLNILSVARGKERVELQMKEIAIQSIKRAFAIMALSIFVIGIAIYLVSVTDPGKPWIALVFECVSAFSTVGLSLGITGELSTLGKIVIMVVMFVGRVGTLTILIGMLAQVQFQSYQYPEENIMIN